MNDDYEKEIASLKDQLAWSLKNEKQYKDALKEAATKIVELKALNRELIKESERLLNAMSKTGLFYK